MELLDFVTEMIKSYGYIIVTVAIMLESAGIPMPGETVLVISAAFAGAGHLNIAGVIIAAAIGAIVGDAGGYWIGRHFGRPFLDKYGKWLHLTPQRMENLEKLFLRHGPMTVFFGRFFSLLRTYAALFAGMLHMPYKTFTLYNALGGIVWAMCFGMIGYLFGQNLPLLEKIARTVGWALTIPLVLFIVAVILWRWAVKHQEMLTRRSHELIEKSFIGRFVKKYSWQIHWLLRHWTAVQYTVGHIVVGLVVACIGIWAFAGVAHSAYSDALIADWDRKIFEVFQGWATPLATTVFTLFTILGSYGTAAAALAALVYFAFRKHWLQLSSLAGTVLGGQILVFVLKTTFARQRPDPGEFHFLSGFGFSFPSGHAMESMIVYGMIAYFLILSIKHWAAGTGIALATILLILTIGFSRLYLGANYLSDVLCGFSAGLVWLSSCLVALELLRRGQVGDRRRHKRVKARTQVIQIIETPVESHKTSI